jgi:hypothetical protein
MVVPRNTNSHKLYNCVVFDVDNWYCDNGDASYYGVEDGEYTEYHKSALSDDSINKEISMVKYYYLQIMDYLHAKNIIA